MAGESQVTVRRFLLLLWGGAVGLTLLLLFVTLHERPVDHEALRHFSADLLLRGRQFTQEASVAAAVRSLATFALLAFLCFHPRGARFIRGLERRAGGRPWLGVLLVAVGISVAVGLVGLPFSFYLGYYHEKAYGLTRQTPGGWLIDHLIAQGLQLGLTLLFWLPIYALIRRWPRRWWVPAALFNLLVTGVLVLLAPILWIPLQGKVVPVRDPQVQVMIERLAQKAGVRVERVQEMLVSERTSRANAMVTGLGMTKQVIVYDTLLQQFDPAEVEVVLAHELAHAAYRDVVTGWLFSGAIEAFTIFVAAWVLQAMVGVGPLFLPSPGAARGLAVLILLTSLMGTLTSPVQQYLSRQMEVRADRFALTVTGNPGAFISGFKRLAQGNPGDVDPAPLVEFLSHSHPSIMNRIRAAETRLSH